MVFFDNYSFSVIGRSNQAGKKHNYPSVRKSYSTSRAGIGGRKKVKNTPTSQGGQEGEYMKQILAQQHQEISQQHQDLVQQQIEITRQQTDRLLRDSNASQKDSNSCKKDSDSAQRDSAQLLDTSSTPTDSSAVSLQRESSLQREASLQRESSFIISQRGAPMPQDNMRMAQDVKRRGKTKNVF